jgi:hypothetical protein
VCARHTRTHPHTPPASSVLNTSMHTRRHTVLPSFLWFGALSQAGVLASTLEDYVRSGQDHQHKTKALAEVSGWAAHRCTPATCGTMLPCCTTVLRSSPPVLAAHAPMLSTLCCRRLAPPGGSFRPGCSTVNRRTVVPRPVPMVWGFGYRPLGQPMH